MVEYVSKMEMPMFEKQVKTKNPNAQKYPWRSVALGEAFIVPVDECPNKKGPYPSPSVHQSGFKFVKRLIDHPRTNKKVWFIKRVA